MVDRCELCDKIFFTVQTLRQHIIGIHLENEEVNIRHLSDKFVLTLLVCRKKKREKKMAEEQKKRNQSFQTTCSSVCQGEKCADI